MKTDAQDPKVIFLKTIVAPVLERRQTRRQEKSFPIKWKWNHNSNSMSPGSQSHTEYSYLDSKPSKLKTLRGTSVIARQFLQGSAQLTGGAAHSLTSGDAQRFRKSPILMSASKAGPHLTTSTVPSGDTQERVFQNFLKQSISGCNNHY